MYNQVSQCTGSCMPLLMGYTHPEKIREAESDEPVVVYDHKRQIAVIKPFIMRMVGTKSLRNRTTRKPGKATVTDAKNEIDDQKNV